MYQVKHGIAWWVLRARGKRGVDMTKGELKKALNENMLPDDTEVLVSTGKYHDSEPTWDEILYVDGTENGPPILIGLGDTVMG